MQKRLKEIVIYILEHGQGLEPEQRAQLEVLRSELAASGLSLEAIEETLRQVLELEPGQGLRSKSSARPGGVSERKAYRYLQRLVSLGLIDEEQREEILERARRLQAESPGLDMVEFLAASVIFDESLGFVWGWDGEIQMSVHNLH